MAKKIGLAILALTFIGIVLYFTLPNGFNGGNKNIIKADNSYVEPTGENAHGAAAAHSEEASELNHTFQFTAFKTPNKVPVSGTFNKIELTNTQHSDTLEAALKGANFVVHTESINTNDATNTRDAKLKEFFFGNLTSQEITGTFHSFENGMAKVSITMNGVTKDFDFKYISTANDLSFAGTIDVVKDFSANKSLDAIAEACKALHEDKTWSDVNINVSFKK